MIDTDILRAFTWIMAFVALMLTLSSLRNLRRANGEYVIIRLLAIVTLITTIGLFCLASFRQWYVDRGHYHTGEFFLAMLISLAFGLVPLFIRWSIMLIQQQRSDNYEDLLT